MKTTLPLTALLLAGTCAAFAKPPTVDRLFPAGAQRGQTVAVTAEGSFDHWPIKAWSDLPGLTVTSEKDKGKLSIQIPADALPGLHWLRLYDDEGASAPRPFFVGTLPEVNETGSKDAPQSLDAPQVVVNGRLARRGEVDAYAVNLKACETLVAAVEANHRLGSPMDAVLQIVTPRGLVLAQNDDDQGFDPFLVFKAPADGTYHVRLFAFPATPDASIAFAGGSEFVYRLTLTTGGYLGYAYPLALPRDHLTQVEAHGWNIPEEAKRLDVASDEQAEAALLSHPRLANVAAVRLEPHPTVTEAEPNDRDHPQGVEPPVTITGRIDPARDTDVFQFAGKKGQSLRVRVEARTLGSPLDPVLRVTDKDGKTLSEVDDSGKQRDAELSFSPPADGTYRIQVRDLHGQGGDRYVYRLSAAAPRPDYDLSLAEDRFTLTPEKPLSVAVKVERKDGFEGVIEIRAEGLPEGVEAAPARSEPKGNTARSVTLTLTSKAAGAASAAIRIIGAPSDGSAPPKGARIPISGSDVPLTKAWLTVLAPPDKK